jgi:hypothetical protein
MIIQLLPKGWECAISLLVARAPRVDIDGFVKLGAEADDAP